jgi:hypothetical protein
MASKPFTTKVHAVVGKSGGEWIVAVYTHRTMARTQCADLNRKARGTGHRFVTRAARLTVKLDRKVRRVG